MNNRRPLTRREAVTFYTADPKNNPDYVKLMECIMKDERLTGGEKEMLIWTVETIFGIGYSIYDHLYFHTHDMLKVMDVGIALNTADTYETTMIKAVRNEILPIVFKRAMLYAKTHHTSHAFLSWLKDIENMSVKILQFSKRGVLIR